MWTFVAARSASFPFLCSAFRPRRAGSLAAAARTKTLFRMASTLPRLAVFEAISRHDPESTVVVHSLSGRRFKYGELLGDVWRTRNRLHEAAGTCNLNGERVAFLVENSYDYVGKLLIEI